MKREYAEVQRIIDRKKLEALFADSKTRECSCSQILLLGYKIKEKSEIKNNKGKNRKTISPGDRILCEFPDNCEENCFVVGKCSSGEQLSNQRNMVVSPVMADTQTTKS